MADMFPATSPAFSRIASIEQMLKKKGALVKYSGSYFKKGSSSYKIEDDHIPFLKRNVICAFVVCL